MSYIAKRIEVRRQNSEVRMKNRNVIASDHRERGNPCLRLLRSFHSLAMTHKEYRGRHKVYPCILYIIIFFTRYEMLDTRYNSILTSMNFVIFDILFYAILDNNKLLYAVRYTKYDIRHTKYDIRVKIDKFN